MNDSSYFEPSFSRHFASRGSSSTHGLHHVAHTLIHRHFDVDATTLPPISAGTVNFGPVVPGNMTSQKASVLTCFCATFVVSARPGSGCSFLESQPQAVKTAATTIRADSRSMRRMHSG